MTYRALYRVFRPQTFAEVRGQNHISTTLKNAIRTERLAHAYLFCGPRGTGKTSSAKILAKAVNCLDLQDGEPCNRCANCQAINEDNFLDVIEIDAASNRGIDEIRVLREKVRFAPSQGKRKVYIIDEVHMLTTEAFNALLKTLEEPPAHVLFILATTDPQKIPLTILSRCQRFDFRKLDNEEIAAQLRDIVAEEHVTVDDDALAAIVRRAAGGMRDAISVLDQCIAFAGDHVTLEQVEQMLGTMREEDAAALLDAVTAQNYALMFQMLHDFVQQGKDIKQVMRDLVLYCRQLLLLKVAPKQGLVDLGAQHMERAKAQVASLSLEFLNRAIAVMQEAERDIFYSSQPQVVVENVLVTLMLEGEKARAEREAAAQAISAPAQAAGAARQTPRPVRKLVPSDQLLAQWSKVMGILKDRSIKLYALLNKATPAAFQDGELLLRFPNAYSFHCDAVQQEENLRLIAQAVEQLTGAPARVTVELEDAAGNIPQELGIVEEARRLFGDVPIEITD